MSWAVRASSVWRYFLDWRGARRIRGVTSPRLPTKRTRWLVALAVATLLASPISGAAHAGEGAPGTPPAAAGTAAPGDGSGSSSDPAGADKPATGEAPSLQIQDEGPTAASDRTRPTRLRIAPVGEAEERPFWKSPTFWILAGVLVAGAVGMLAYSTSGSRSDLAPCPVDVEVSLGCFGAGR